MASINYNSIARRLEAHSCPTCGAHPEVSIEGTNISINSCCESFRSSMVEKLGEYMKEEAARILTESFKKGFRRR